MAHEHRFARARGVLMHDSPVQTNFIGRTGARSQGRDMTVDGDTPGSDPLLGFPA